MDRRAAAQIGQREVGLPIAAEGGAEQREQRLVLVDRQKLAVAQRPTLVVGAKLNDIIRISERNGSAMGPPLISTTKILVRDTKRNYTNKST